MNFHVARTVYLWYAKTCAVSEGRTQKNSRYGGTDMKKMALVLAAVLASGMILTACGGSGKSGTAGN